MMDFMNLTGLMKKKADNFADLFFPEAKEYGGD